MVNEHGRHSLPQPSGYKSGSLTIRPRLPCNRQHRDYDENNQLCLSILFFLALHLVILRPGFGLLKCLWCRLVQLKYERSMDQSSF